MNRKNKSVVWQHFEKKTQDSALCLLCKCEFRCKNNTSNLRDHLKRKHVGALEPEIFDPVYLDDPMETVSPRKVHTDPTAPTSVETSSGDMSSVPSTSSESRPVRIRQRQLTLHGSFQTRVLSEEKIKVVNSLVMGMVAKDLQPLSIVENEGFKKLVKELEPRYTLPSRRVLTRTLLPEAYDSARQALKEKLNAAAHVSVTTDIWTSINNSSFMTVTTHFFNNEGNLESKVIATIELSMNHTGHYLATLLQEEFVKWNIKSKIAAIVTDGGANIKAAVSITGICHLPCIAHMLNLIVQNALKQTEGLEEILLACRAIVAYFKTSVSASDKLKYIQNQMGLTELKLKKDVVTRWNSVFYMMERLSETKEVLSAALVSLPNGPTSLSIENWTVLDDCIMLLRPLEQMTRELSAQKYPTVSMIIPLVRGIQLSISSKVLKTAIGNNLKKNLLEGVNRRLGQVEKMDIPAAATLLDPRFKKAAFGNESNAETAKKFVTEQLATLCRTSSIAENACNETTGDIHVGDSLWGFLDARVSATIQKENPVSNAIVMFRHYLEQPYEERKKDPMMFWKRNKEVMKELYLLAEKYLSVPATSVPSERIFSKAGQIMSERRNRLKGKHLDMLIFLHTNL